MSAELVDLILRRTAYMTLATADGDGLPWASPVWFAVGDDRALYWVSRPASVHSQNIAARADVSVVVFDTNARVGEAQAVYARARASQVPDGDGIEVFSRASVDAGIGSWTVAEVTAPAELRLYRADLTELSLLDAQVTGGRDVRVPVGMTAPYAHRPNPSSSDESAREVRSLPS
jgi:pyridoxine/pyridoxamine 5'-phosphate oxidase